jgi:hypothetical protein
MHESPNTARLCFAAAASSLILGGAVAAARFPGGFDWTYTVVSHLASTSRNPDGGRWVSGSLLMAVAFLWPVTHHLHRKFARTAPRPRASIAALRIGLIGGALLALEGLVGLDLSRLGRKGHEAVAVATFLGFYGGVLGLYFHRIRQAASFLVPALLVILPLCAVGVTQLALYLGQAELGWVNPGWREIGVPFWLSFAFWQWLAVAFLGMGLGTLVLTGDADGGGDRGTAHS